MVSVRLQPIRDIVVNGGSKLKHPGYTRHFPVLEPSKVDCHLIFFVSSFKGTLLKTKWSSVPIFI